jgi:hypothetical protein
VADVWETWVGGRSVAAFLREVDRAVADGVFRDRRAAFVEYAECVLTWLATSELGPQLADPGIGAGRLADMLLAYALDKESQNGQAKVVAARRCGGA